MSASDALCQSLASAAKLGGSYVALMSNSTVNARDKFPDRAYHRIDDVKVADDKADMFDGSLDAFINVTQLGVTLTGQSIDTGTLPDGTAGLHCTDWTVTGGSAQKNYGIFDTRSGWWVGGNVALCFGQGRVYCIQSD